MEDKNGVQALRRLKYVLLMVLVLFSLCGCEQQNDSIKNEVASLEEAGSSGEAEEGDVDKLKKKLHIPKELQIDVLSDDGKRGYQVNCNVDVPIETSPSVYQQKKRPFTEEEIIKRAEKVFDSGEFSYVKPLDCYTMEELNKEYAQIEELLEDNNAEYREYYATRCSDISVYKDNYIEAEVQDFKEGEFTKGSRAASYDEIMIMEGEISGEIYHLLAFTSEGHNYLKLCRLCDEYILRYNGMYYFGYELKLAVGDWSSREEVNTISDEEDAAFLIDRSAIRETGATEAVRKQYGENICSYSEEEAKRLALQYAALLGDADMTIASTNWNWDYVTTSQYDLEKSMNGYVFYLQRQYGGLPCNESNFWWREATDTKEEMARRADPSGIVAEQECYRVEVADEGVISIDTIEPWYEITETLSESTTLMDFNEIEELAKGYFAETVKDVKVVAGTKANITHISEVALRYATVYDNGEYSLIPCWFFNESRDVGRSTIMVINAIDGSKVFMRRI